MKNKIIQILVDGEGWINADEKPIELIWVNGEMSQVPWYRHKNREFNGKYVVEIVWEKDLQTLSKMKDSK